ncbi:hypothetical protein OIE50_50865 [Streptomyces canus]
MMATGMRNIQVDDEVFAYLQRHSEPLVDTANDVLRRVLLGAQQPPVDEAGSRPTGALMPILEAGLAAPNDMLRHHQPKLGRTHEATISADGWVELPDGRAFQRPSPALRTQTGNQINGWGQYTHVPSGRPLQELREEAAKTQD